MNPWYRSLVESEAKIVGLDPDVVQAVIFQESSGRAAAFRYEPGFYARYLKDKPEFNIMDPQRVSASYGLMQIMYPVAHELGFRQEPEYLFVPSINLHYGVAHLAGMVLWAGGDLRKAFAAYNGGKGGVNAPMPQHYAESVLTILGKIRAARVVTP